MRAMLVGLAMMLVAGCGLGLAGCGGADGGEPPRCVAPEVVCENGWHTVRSWAPRVGTVANAQVTFDDPAAPSPDLYLSSVRCSPPGETTAANFDDWTPTAIEAFGEDVTVGWHESGDVREVARYTAGDRLRSFTCDPGAERAYLVFEQFADGGYEYSCHLEYASDETREFYEGDTLCEEGRQPGRATPG